MGDDEFYIRYYVGHKGKFGHEFLEFECPGAAGLVVFLPLAETSGRSEERERVV